MARVINNPTDDLLRRKDNLEIVIQVAQEELYHIIKEIERLTKPNKIWFKQKEKPIS